MSTIGHTNLRKVSWLWCEFTWANFKLQVLYMEPYTVLRRIGANAYVLDIPEDMHTNPIFNVTNLMPYHAPLPIDTCPPESADDYLPAYSLNENTSHLGRIGAVQIQVSEDL